MHVHRRSTLLAVVVVVTAAGCAAPLTQRETTVGGGVGALEGSSAPGDEFETRERRDIAADREIQAHEREIRRQRAAIAEIRRRQEDDAYDRFDDDRYDRDDDRYHSSDGYAPD
jgi:hypothetical protein